jgi:hypothetical protein
MKMGSNGGCQSLVAYPATSSSTGRKPPPVNEIAQLQDADFSLRDLLLMSEGRKEIPTAIELAILLYAKVSQA